MFLEVKKYSILLLCISNNNKYLTHKHLWRGENDILTNNNDNLYKILLLLLLFILNLNKVALAVLLFKIMVCRK